MAKQHEKEGPIFQKSNGMDIRIGKYRRSRFWGIWINGELLAVTVYKRGAISICKQVIAREIYVRPPACAPKP